MSFFGRDESTVGDGGPIIDELPTENAGESEGVANAWGDNASRKGEPGAECKLSLSPRFMFGSTGRSSRVIFGGGGGGVSVALPCDGEGGGGGRSSSLESGGKALEDVEGVLFPLSMKAKD